MQDNFSTIRSAFEEAGIDIPTAAFSITAYSLNTGLSFKFGNLEEFLLFLGLHSPENDSRIEEVTVMLIEASIDPKSFFYVNFYKPKVAEL